MQFSILLLASLASLAVGTEAPHENAPKNIEARHDVGDHAYLYEREADLEIVSSPPKAVAARSEDDGLAMSGAYEQDTDNVLPPSMSKPRSEDQEFGMSGVTWWRTKGHDAKTIQPRQDGFMAVSSPPKVAAGHTLRRDNTFEVRSSRSNIPSPVTDLYRRVNLWASNLLGNLLNKFSGKSPTTPFVTGTSTLTPYQQNGPSKYGTPAMGALPKYIGGASAPPFANITTTNANPYKSCPDTGEMRIYDLTLAECDIRPDGVETKKAICINGQFPGPLIEANYGDMIQVKVTNNLVGEGTSMHWHGFLQTGTNHMDGVPGVTQCPIAPGTSQVYTFRAELYGSAWYHTHYSAQYAGGAVGPMVIYGPTNSKVDIDIGPVMLMDWYRAHYQDSVRGLLRPIAQGGLVQPLTNSNLINGKMKYPCEKTNLTCVDADYAAFKFEPGKNHLLRLMNTGSNAVQKISIDRHQMQVIANDFVPVQPYNVSMIALGVGQRADVIVYANGTAGDKFWIRSNIGGCSANDGKMTEARAAIYYGNIDLRNLPTAGPNEGPASIPEARFCGNSPLPLTIPSWPLKASTPAATKYLDIQTKNNGTHMVIHFGERSFRGNYNDPLLQRALVGLNSAYEPERNVWNVGPAMTMRAVIHNYDAQPHPIHLHGHNIQVLNAGFGVANESVIVNPDNPQRRDVQIMPPGSLERPSFLVIQWDADNPGLWPLHCHFNWHSALGLAVNVLETPDEIANAMGTVASGPMAETCRTWAAFVRSNGLDTAIDSGM